MRRVVNLYRTTVGKKILMAGSGLILFGFVVGHMAGNLKVLQGREAFNAYAEFLRDFGYPLLPHEGLLWIIRIVLLGAVILHFVSAFQLWKRSADARSTKYRKQENISFSYASQTMRWGGVILLLFIVYHILHMTMGTVHTDFVHGDVYHNYLVAFRIPLVFAFYLIAQAALGLHLYHGLWSATQTLGANHPKYNAFRRPIAIAFALVIFVGFMIPPVLIITGIYPGAAA